MLDEHRAFLLDLFAQTFGYQFNKTGMPVDMVTTLVNQQSELKEAAYQNSFPDATHSIIKLDGKPVGQIRLSAGTKEQIHIIDISVLPAKQGKGVATSVIQDLLLSKRGQAMGVCLSVERGTKAQALYQKLGFVVTREGELYDHMVCKKGFVRRQR